MKKLTLLFVALVAASATYAKEVMPVAENVEVAPKLKVESMGTFINYYNLDVDVSAKSATIMLARQVNSYSNELSIDDDLNRIEYGITTNLSYGDDWTFDILASDNYIKGVGGIVNDMSRGYTDLGDRFSSYSSKLKVGAWRHYDNFSIGAQWAHGNNLDDFELFSTLIGDAWKQDIFSLRGKYHYPVMDGTLLGWADLKYGFVNDTMIDLAADDNFKYYEIEGMPVAYKYGPVTFGYYIKHREFDDFYDAEFTEQQLRLSADLYSNEKLSIYGEYRYGLKMDIDGQIEGHSLSEAFDTKVLSSGDRQQFILGAKYSLTENLMLDANISYQILEYNVGGEAIDDMNIDVDNKFKETQLGLGLTYQF
ncbi:hypothetical protein [Fusobacterium sp. MFO224]|uniref:hypothetical protein n=1 Tax=Fusobacterium sp. MFO224 TaxID=3378070 RepID=UPI003852D26E